MDKQRLVYEAERNRIREESDRKYESANWFKKFGMFVGNRARQRRDIQESMKQARTNSTFIETDNTLQSRIEGNIGTYAEQHDMNIEGNNLKQRETIDGDGRIDAIAHEYIMGNISHTDAVRQFNFVFEHLYNTRKDISEIGSMTGTDIMAQLNNMNANEKKNYQIRHTIMEVFNNESIRVPSLSAEKITTIQALCKKRGISLSSLELTQQFELLKQEAIRQNIDNVSGTTHKMKVQLRAMVKKEKTEEIEGVRYDGMDSGIR